MGLLDLKGVGDRCRANMAHLRHPRPDSGLVVQVQVLKKNSLDPFLFGSGPGREAACRPMSVPVLPHTFFFQKCFAKINSLTARADGSVTSSDLICWRHICRSPAEPCALLIMNMGDCSARAGSHSPGFAITVLVIVNTTLVISQLPYFTILVIPPHLLRHVVPV